jgi:DNA-binding transcriptional ArsR family regulator
MWQVVSDIGVLSKWLRWAGVGPVPVMLTYNQMVVDEKPTRDEEGATDLLFRALADPIRRDILRRAHEGRLSVSALAREHPISVTAMQKHVAVLERAELVSKHRVGRESIVQTEADALARAHTALDRLEADWRGRIERMEQILETDKGDS